VRSSASRPTSGASSASSRRSPPTPDSTQVARHRCCGSVFPFSACSPASANPTPPSASRLVAPSTNTDPGSAAVCTRAAVLIVSPAIPSPTTPTVTATSPVTTPHRAASPGAPVWAPSSATPATRSSPARTARSASPSVATGAPHTAITASPMNFSTIPPYRPITVRAIAKYSLSSSRTVSGSRDSDSGVNPTRSQNSTEHTRRSATGRPSDPAGGAAGDDEAATGRPAAATSPEAGPASAYPQAGQNRSPGGTGSRHDGHPPRGAPQPPQNRSPSPRDAPHCGHVTTSHLYPLVRALVHGPVRPRPLRGAFPRRRGVPGRRH
jgi:hypothetical protein